MNNAILRFPQVQAMTGLSRSTIYNRINPRSKFYDSEFPKPINLGPRLIGWSQESIDSWIEKTIKASLERDNDQLYRSA